MCDDETDEEKKDVAYGSDGVLVPGEVPMVEVEELSSVESEGVVLRSLERDEIGCMIRFDFHMTNNKAEYEALVARLDLTKVAGATSVVIHCDSQVITNQVNGDYECKGERMKKYLEQVRRRVGDLQAKIV